MDFSLTSHYLCVHNYLCKFIYVLVWDQAWYIVADKIRHEFPGALPVAVKIVDLQVESLAIWMLLLLKVGNIPQGILFCKSLFSPKMGWIKNSFISHAYNYVGPLLHTT